MADVSTAHQLYVGVAIAADTFTASWLAPGGTPSTPRTYDWGCPVATDTG